MQQPGFFDLVAPGHFAEAVEAEDSCKTGMMEPAFARQDDCHAGVYGAGRAVGKLMDEFGVNWHPWDIGKGVFWAGPKAAKVEDWKKVADTIMKG